MTDTEHNSDLKLVTLLRTGDYDAFKEIHGRYALPVFRQALAMTGDPAAAEDVTQDVFVALWEKRSRLSVQTSLAAYIYGITRFTLLGRLKKKKSLSRYLDNIRARITAIATAPDDILIQKEQARRMEAEIGRLPDRMREVVLLSRAGLHSYREIAALLGITEGTVKNQVSTAVKILRGKLHQLVVSLF